ncbi:MAG: S41 family peptidase [Herpetosiphon sp.]
MVRRSSPATIKKDFDIYWQAWDLVDQSFYRDKSLDRRKMIYASIAGMMHSLGDDYTFFQEPDEASKTREQLDGQFEGIGAYIVFKDGHIVISAPIEGSPAEKAGILANDIVLRVDGNDLTQQVAQLDADGATKQAIKLIRGPRGSNVKLSILRPATQQMIEISIRRDNVPLITVHVKRLINDVAYIQITQFEGTTIQQLDKAIQDLMTQHLHGIVLDLRNNPGGLLESAQQVLGRFINDGPALFERFGNGEEKRFDVQRPTTSPSLLQPPMVVLINNASASASEIVAGALRDHNRATLLGEKTFGKGSVQTVARLADGSSARITIARWLTPNKQQIHKIGIMPGEYVPFSNEPRYRVDLPVGKMPEPDHTDDSQLFWAIRELATNEHPPAVPIPTSKPTS